MGHLGTLHESAHYLRRHCGRLCVRAWDTCGNSRLVSACARTAFRAVAGLIVWACLIVLGGLIFVGFVCTHD